MSARERPADRPREEPGFEPPSRVRRRDGREVPFDAGRVVAAVAAAQHAVGDDDPPFAEEVADVVRLTLAARLARAGAEGSAGTVVDLEDVQDTVEQALIEMGRASVAKAYILYRDRRARAREALLGVAGGRMPSEARTPLVRESRGVAPWSRARIVRALVVEADLARETAEGVAERVEHRVLDTGLRTVSTGLVRELVSAELAALGLAGALRRQGTVGLPRHDLRRLVLRPVPAIPEDEERPLGQERLEELVAGELLGRWALDEVVDEPTAELLRTGELALVDLGQPQRVLVRAVPAELLLRRAASPQAPFELLAEVAGLVAGTTRGLVLEDLARIAAPLGLGTDGGRGVRARERLRDVLRGFAAVGRAAGRPVDLSRPGGRGPLVAALVEALAALARDGEASPRLYLSWDELVEGLGGDPGDGPRAEDVELLLSRKRLVPVWSGDDEVWVAPGCRRRARERVALACGGAVALNLPRLARRAGPWREERLFAELSGAVEAALGALQQAAEFQREVRAARGEPLRERLHHALAPVGLIEALRILGDGEVRVEAGARLLGFLAEASVRFARGRGLSVALSPFFASPARWHFAALDARRPRPSQPRLFAELPAPEEAREEAYHAGFDLPPFPDREAGAVHAALLATVRSGALAPFPMPHGPSSTVERAGAGGATARTPRLDLWRRFDRERRPPVPDAGAAAGDPAPLFRAPSIPAEA